MCQIWTRRPLNIYPLPIYLYSVYLSYSVGALVIARINAIQFELCMQNPVNPVKQTPGWDKLICYSSMKNTVNQHWRTQIHMSSLGCNGCHRHMVEIDTCFINEIYIINVVQEGLIAFSSLFIISRLLLEIISLWLIYLSSHYHWNIVWLPKSWWSHLSQYA